MPECLAGLLLCKMSAQGHMKTGTVWGELCSEHLKTEKCNLKHQKQMWPFFFFFWFSFLSSIYVGFSVFRMDSFFLAEMFKYLYLMFSEKSHLPIDMDGYIFTTEAHLLPISLSTTQPPCPGNDTVRALTLSQTPVQMLSSSIFYTSLCIPTTLLGPPVKLLFNMDI